MPERLSRRGRPERLAKGYQRRCFPAIRWNFPVELSKQEGPELIARGL
jgi:hypothetical protein